MGERVFTALVALAAGAVGGIVFGQVSNLGASSHERPTAFVPLEPAARLLDTRQSGDITGGNPLTEGQTLQLQVTGRDGVPSDARAVQLNVTVAEGTAASFLSVWDEGEWPGTSSLNWADASASPNAVTTSVGSDGFIRIYNDTGTVHTIVDVTGYFTTAGIVSDFETVSEEFPVNLIAGNTAGRSVICPDGKLAVGGGASVVDIPGRLILLSSVPRSDGTGWSGRAGAVGSGTVVGTLTVYSICASGVTRAAPSDPSESTD
jgi:hypothetical protein